MKKRILGILLCIAMLLCTLCLTACGDSDKGKDKGKDKDDDDVVVSAYSDPEKMTKDLLEAMFNGDGEDVWEAVNLDGLLDLAVKYGNVDKSDKAEQKQDMIDYFDEICEDLQDTVEDVLGDDLEYKFVVDSTNCSKSEIKDLQAEIDPDGDLELEGATVCEYEVYIDDELYDYGSITYIKVDGEWIMYSQDDNGSSGGNVVSAYSDPEEMTRNLLEAMFNGDGEDVWDAVNFDALLELSVKLGNIDSSEKAEQRSSIIDYFDEICETLQDAVAEELGYNRDYSFAVESTDCSKSEIKDLQAEIDPDGNLELEGAVVCEYVVYIDGESYDYGSITFIKVDGEWIMYG